MPRIIGYIVFMGGFYDVTYTYLNSFFFIFSSSDILASQVLESLEMFRIRLREVQRIQTITTFFGLLTKKEKTSYVLYFVYEEVREKITESPEGITEDLKEMSFNLRATLLDLKTRVINSWFAIVQKRNYFLLTDGPFQYHPIV